MKEKINLILMRADRTLLAELLAKLERRDRVKIKLDYFTMLKEAMI